MRFLANGFYFFWSNITEYDLTSDDCYIAIHVKSEANTDDIVSNLVFLHIYISSNDATKL